MKYFIVLISALIILGCDNSDNQINKEFDRSGSAQKITVVTYTSLAKLQRAKAEVIDATRDRETLGWSRWSPNNIDYGCQIHVMEPTSGAITKTWGHELQHCIYGSFHEEQEN